MSCYRNVVGLFLFGLIFIFSPRHIDAQATAKDSVVLGWKRQFNGLLNLNQAYYDNWTKGGTDALSWELNFNGGAVLEQEHHRWESNGKIRYGQTKIQALSSRKSSDEWDLETIYTWKMGAVVNPFVSASGQSQFTTGYTYNDSAGTRTKVSDFFDPAYFMQTIGVGITPVKDLTERLGATMKQTISGTYGYADDAKTKSKVEEFKQEYGLSSVTEYQIEMMKNIVGVTRLDLFINFKGLDEVDGKWENRITAKVNKLINANFEYDLLYDKDLSLDKQSREALSIGIAFLSL